MDIIKENVRILRPTECTQLINAISKNDHRIMFKALLYSGCRYAELKRLKSNPEWFDGNFIYLPSLKKKCRQAQRWVRLNPVGRTIIDIYLHSKSELPHIIGWNENLKRWAEKSIGSNSISAKTTRKTWESWLFYYYGNRVEIYQSQGHTLKVSMEHYLNLPFIESEKQEMKPFVEGWL